jgi:hypothetical protein
MDGNSTGPKIHFDDKITFAENFYNKGADG